MKVINEEYKEYKLDNGLVVALKNTPTQKIAIQLKVNYGSSYEKKGEEGIAHLLEHCLNTGGSEKYNPIQADEIRGSLGYFNIFTNIKETYFVGQMLIEDFETWLDYVSDHVFRPRFEKERVNGERKRVLREIAEDKSDPTYLHEKEYQNLLYMGHPKGISILGKEKVVKNADVSKIKAFHSRGFHPNNMDIIVVGGLPRNTDQLINKYFGQISRGKNTRKTFPELKPLEGKTTLHYYAPDLINVDNPEESSATLTLAYRGPIETHEDKYVCKTINRILGGDTNSLLFRNMGLNKGLAYEVKTFYDGNYNVGNLGISANVPAKRIDEAVDSIFDEIKRMKTEKVENKTLKRIKKLAKYDFVSSFESNNDYVSSIEWKLDTGLNFESFIKGYNSITPEKILEVANKYFPDQEEGNYILYIRDPLKK